MRRTRTALLAASLAFCWFPPSSPGADEVPRETRGEKTVEAPSAERRARDRQVLRDVERWARGKEGADEARARIRGLPTGERSRHLARALLGSKAKSARLLAARELGACDASVAIPALAAGAVRDSYRSVRDSCLRSLKLFEQTEATETGPEVGNQFVPYLRSASPDRRTRAANALSLFPRREAIPVLLDTMRLTWTGFGRGFFSQVTQRAYIADYELVSGGTGFSIVEVADPIVRTMQTGVALDVHVRKVELVARLRALVKISGQDFGTDFAAWKRWWESETRDTPLSGK